MVQLPEFVDFKVIIKKTKQETAKLFSKGDDLLTDEMQEHSCSDSQPHLNPKDKRAVSVWALLTHSSTLGSSVWKGRVKAGVGGQTWVERGESV